MGARALLALWAALALLALCSADGRREGGAGGRVEAALVAGRRATAARPTRLALHRREGARAVSDKKVEATALSGGFEQDTAYYTKLKVGTPPQELKMLVDTGSANVVVPDIACARPWTLCSASSYYNASASTSSHRAAYSSACDARAEGNGCEMQVNYIEHTSIYTGPTYVIGNLYSDLAAVASLNANTSIISFTEESYDFQSGEFDGVLGFAYDAVAHAGTTSWFSSLVRDGDVADVFSMCFGQYGGTLVLGGSDADLQASELKYTPITKESYYLVGITSISVGGTEIANDDDDDIEPAVIDTAFEDIILPFSLHTAFVSAITEEYCEGGGSAPPGLCGVKSLMNGFCFHISPSEFSKYPTLTLHLNNDVLLSFSAEYYLYRASGKYCMGIIGQNVDSGVQNIILGQRLFYKYYVVFDRDQRLIGFAQAANCTGASYVADIVSGNNQKGTLNKSLKDEFVIRVRSIDTSEPVKGLTVTWKVQQGDGEITEMSGPTDEEGLASAQYKFGSAEGDHYVTATVQLALNSPVLFTASANMSNAYLLASLFALIALVLFLLFIVYKAAKRKKMLDATPMAASNLPQSSVPLLRADDEEEQDLLSNYGVVTSSSFGSYEDTKANIADVILDE